MLSVCQAGRTSENASPPISRLKSCLYIRSKMRKDPADNTVVKYLRCDAKLGFRVFMRLDNNQPHAALSPHGAGELFDVFRTMEFSHSVETLNTTHTHSLSCAHLCWISCGGDRSDHSLAVSWYRVCSSSERPSVYVFRTF